MSSFSRRPKMSRDALFHYIARKVVPDSLSSYGSTTNNHGSQDARTAMFRHRPWPEASASRVRAVQPGDLIVVTTPGGLYHFARNVAKAKQDHLAVVVDETQFLHIGPPRVRLLPLELLLDSKRLPTVYRPTLSRLERDKFIQSMLLLLGQRYDTVRVYAFLAKLGLRRRLNLRQPFKRKADETVHICTDAILSRLMDCSSKFQTLLRDVKLSARLDYSTLKSYSLRDVERLHAHAPHMLAIVPLPPVPQRLRLPAQVQVRRKRRSDEKTRSPPRVLRNPYGSPRVLQIANVLSQNLTMFFNLPVKERRLAFKQWLDASSHAGRPLILLVVQLALLTSRRLPRFMVRYGTLLTLIGLWQSVRRYQNHHAARRRAQREDSSLWTSLQSAHVPVRRSRL